MSLDLVKPRTPRYCSFCGNSDDEVSILFAGAATRVFICDECVEEAQKIVNKKKAELPAASATK